MGNRPCSTRVRLSREIAVVSVLIRSWRAWRGKGRPGVGVSRRPAGNLDSLHLRGNQASARLGTAPREQPRQTGEYVPLERVKGRRSEPSRGGGTAPQPCFDPARSAVTP